MLCSSGQTRRQIRVLGIDTEIVRLRCAATAVAAHELAAQSDLLVSLGGDGTMLRAMRLADTHVAPVLGVNLGKLGFLAEVDVPDLPDALSAVDAHEFTVEPRMAIDAVVGDQVMTAFNDVAVVRYPGQPSAEIVVKDRWLLVRQVRGRRRRCRHPGGLDCLQLLCRRPHREPGRRSCVGDPRPHRTRRTTAVLLYP